MSKPARVVHTPGEQPAEPEGNDQAAVMERDAAIAAADTAAMAEKLTSNKPEEPGGLRAVDVDASKIKRAVLTLDGWVCPEVAPGYGGER